MPTITIHSTKVIGAIKPMHAVNNGPIITRGTQCRENLTTFQAAKIPFARTHDASIEYAYGGCHTIDVDYIFTDFDRDPTDPTAYDFAVTDRYIQDIRSAGCEVYYRLGSSIEHWVKKYNTLPPKDYLKWAEICAHIIRHYNEGWADGFQYHIRYWEIWNEPDLDPEDSDNKRCWGGTQEEFFRFYRVAATYLKQCFPHLKIGGPAACLGATPFLEPFLAAMTEGGERVPLDFFSWHMYLYDPHELRRANMIRARLDAAGYTETESILNEWNYVKDWTDRFLESVETMIGLKGAAFTAACMSMAQNVAIDMLMYYDARPCIFNGMFDFYTLRPLKGYYPFLAFSNLYESGSQIEAVSDDEEIYAVAAVDVVGKTCAMITYYTDEEQMAQPKTVCIRGLLDGATVSLLDETHDLEPIPQYQIKDGTLEIVLQPNTMILVK